MTYSAMKIPSLLWLAFAGLAPVSYAVTLTTRTHCILVSSGSSSRAPLCPGSSMEVDPQVEIIAGFDDNSKSEQTGTPFWQESFVIAPRIKVDITIPGYDQNMPTAYWGDDNCLYAPMKIYPSWFPTPPVLGFFNSNDQQIGCANKDYTGPPIANPWNLLSYGTDNPTPAKKSRLTGSFWDHLKNPNHEYYDDNHPLFHSPNEKSEKSDASSDPSWFNSDTDPSGGTETASLLPPDSSDSGALGDFAVNPSDANQYDLFAPSGDGSSDLASLADFNPDGAFSLDSAAVGNIASGGGNPTDDALWGPSGDVSFDGGNNDLFASLGNDENLFTTRRFRRSSRVFRF